MSDLAGRIAKTGAELAEDPEAEIHRLQQENGRLREALEEIAGAKKMVMNRIISVTKGRHPVHVAKAALSAQDDKQGGEV